MDLVPTPSAVSCLMWLTSKICRQLVDKVTIFLKYRLEHSRCGTIRLNTTTNLEVLVAAKVLFCSGLMILA